MAQGLETRLAGELRPAPARDDDLDSVGGERPRGGDERRQALARGLGGDAEDIGPGEAERRASALGVGRLGVKAGSTPPAITPMRAGKVEEVRELAARELGYGHDVQRATGQGGTSALSPRILGAIEAWRRRGVDRGRGAGAHSRGVGRLAKESGFRPPRFWATICP